MSKLICPFCNEKLDFDDLLGSCINEYCEESFDMVGTELLWQKVIDLKQELERTRKALEVIKKEMSNEYMPDFAIIRDALKGVSDE